ALPDSGRAAAEPMEHIDSLTIMSADGASELVKSTTRVVAESATAIKGLTGLDGPHLIGSAMSSGALAGLRGDGERGSGGARHPTATTVTTPTPAPAAAAAAPATATNGQSSPAVASVEGATSAAAATTAAAVRTAMTGLEASEDEAAKLLAAKLREIPNGADYAHLRLSEVANNGPRPMRILWRIAESQVGKRYGGMTVGELIKRFGVQTAQH